MQVQFSEKFVEWKPQLIEIMTMYAFMLDSQIRGILVGKHRIHLNPQNATPSHAILYRTGPRHCQLYMEEIEELINVDLAEERDRAGNQCWSRWSGHNRVGIANCILTKKNTILRFCVHYRRHQDWTITHSYLIFRIHACKNSLTKGRILLILDASSGSWKIKMIKKDVVKTAFVTHCDLYRFSELLLGLQYAPEAFVRAMDVIRATFKWPCGMVYVGDVIIFFNLFKEYLKHYEKVLRLLIGARIPLKLIKCHFFSKIHWLSGTRGCP